MATSKCRITFALSKTLKNEFREAVNKSGYGFRGKSKWASEAINKLFSLKDFIELVKFNYEMVKNLTEKDTLYLDMEINKKLEEGMTKVRSELPLLEGVKSCIIRAAIIQRIVRGY